MIQIKYYKMNVNFIDIGPKALLIGFRQQSEKNIPKILNWVNYNKKIIKFRNDEKIVIALKGKNINRFKLLKNYLKEISELIKF